MCGSPLVCVKGRKTPEMRSAQTLARLGYYEKIIKYIVTNCLVFDNFIVAIRYE